MNKKIVMVILSLFLLLGAVHALTLVSPINMTAIPFNSKYYNALINGQVYAGNYSANRTQAGAATAVQFPNVSFIGYSTPVTPAVSSNSADGLEFNPYVKETVTFTDSDPAIGTVTVPEFCAANGDLVEFFDPQKTDVLIPNAGGVIRLRGRWRSPDERNQSHAAKPGRRVSRDGGGRCRF
jgi:hypothetical protein